MSGHDPLGSTAEICDRTMCVRSFARGAVPADFNLVLWDWGDAPPRMVRVIDTDERLPRDRSSWQ